MRIHEQRGHENSPFRFLRTSSTDRCQCMLFLHPGHSWYTKIRMPTERSIELVEKSRCSLSVARRTFTFTKKVFQWDFPKRLDSLPWRRTPNCEYEHAEEMAWCTLWTQLQLYFLRSIWDRKSTENHGFPFFPDNISGCAKTLPNIYTEFAEPLPTHTPQQARYQVPNFDKPINKSEFLMVESFNLANFTFYCNIEHSLFFTLNTPHTSCWVIF